MHVIDFILYRTIIILHSLLLYTIMSSTKNKKTPAFSIGAKASRDVRNALNKKSSKKPQEIIADYQKNRSLHSMFAKAFGTTPNYEADDNDDSNVESLDTDSVLQFLGHLGTSKYEVHKRIGDALQKQLEGELRKVNSANSEDALLNLLFNCWSYATTNSEFRPILWAVLKQLGTKTPRAVLQALAEREKKSRKLKHAEIFRPLSPLLKRLVWEADWADKVPAVKENNFSCNCRKYTQMIESTLLYETIQPLIEKYTSTPLLVESSVNFFVPSQMERRLLTSSRRALVNSASVTTASPTRAGVTTSTTASYTAVAVSASTNNASTNTTPPSDSLSQAGKSVSQIRNMLSDISRGSVSYRPDLLHAALSILMAQHGAQASVSLEGTSTGLLAGASHLHCTLVADILLSSGGPLPKIYSNVHRLARKCFIIKTIYFLLILFILCYIYETGFFLNFFILLFVSIISIWTSIIIIPGILDDAVKNGIFSDNDLIIVQETLKLIYDNGNNSKNCNEEKKKKSKDNDRFKMPNKSLIRQLNQIITSGLSEMKNNDPQTLFLNPVTDAIAPGYSKVIKKPMSISTMENKIENNSYHNIKTWEVDVKIMFKNCIFYNSGQAGQWFQNEAKRQQKVFSDEILPQARNLFRIEEKKRRPDEEAMLLKRKREEEEKKKPKIQVLNSGRKKRKCAPNLTLSMPALASMLLADPFVVRILLDRVLRSMRLDTAKGAGIPAEHLAIPSIMQLLFLAQWSPQICAVRGRHFIVFDSGLQLPKNIDGIEDTLPYTSLRQNLPVVMHLLRDADLDKRLAIGGDLQTVAKWNGVPRPEPPLISINDDSSVPQISLSLLEGAFVNACLPGNSRDISLSISFVKFSNAFRELALGVVLNEVSFFKSLVPVILKHKSRLNKTVRDVIISTWLDWLKIAPSSRENKNKDVSRKGSIESAAHEYLIFLLNQWASSFGNILLPRDLLLKVATDVVKTVDATEIESHRKMSELWKADDIGAQFLPIKKQYERLLSILPESHVTQWKESVGITLE